MIDLFPQQPSSGSSSPDGSGSNCEVIHLELGVDSICRCLFPCSDEQESPKVSTIHGESAGLSIHMPSIRASDITQGIYQDTQANSPAALAQRHLVAHGSQWLADLGGLSSKASSQAQLLIKVLHHLDWLINFQSWSQHRTSNLSAYALQNSGLRGGPSTKMHVKVQNTWIIGVWPLQSWI